MDGFRLGVLLDEGIEPWCQWLEELGYDVPAKRTDIYQPADVEVPEGRGATWAPSVYAAEHTESQFITTKALEWLESTVAADDGPWCAHLSYLRPHPPYLAPAPYNDMFDPADVPPVVRHATSSDEAAVHPFLTGAMMVVPSPADDLDQRQLQATYFGMIAEVDAALGRFLDGLDELGQRDNTVVVVTSDHGEQLGDHWLVEKLGFFDQSYRIPLIVRWPGMAGRPGRTVDAFTENVDVLPTVVELAGGEVPDFQDGASLRPFLDEDLESADAPTGWRDAVHTEFDFREPVTGITSSVFGLRLDECAMSVLRDHHGKYVQFAGHLPPLFFDLDDDPDELSDVAADPERAAQVLGYAQRLLALRMAHTDPRLANHRATDDGPVHGADPPRPGR
jgi:arylsulfatase A-like enzyme